MIADKIKDHETLIIAVNATNTGTVSGKEVVRLYTGDRESNVFPPVREMTGFNQALFAPNETKAVSSKLERRVFAYRNTQHHDLPVETGVFTIAIGRSDRYIALATEVFAEGSGAAVDNITVNSTFGDIMQIQKRCGYWNRLSINLSRL